ncbi:DUF2515 family protein [Ornithinibacillus californiensis]|uniref:DUF2515 family protein n=1 Tax=Ornithinibacillus californiensis TaxID=161536 RepID=UPI00064DDDD5|nr:DUF2515 family protein [Ornithinibacillus californiensis]
MKVAKNERDYLHYIINETRKHNIDNISRTKAYQNFYIKHQEIKWSLLASVVSRNAGWNMTDLTLPPYKKMLGDNERNNLFMTYERANWLIFSDAYPQLLVYKLSLKYDVPFRELLEELQISTFMIREWEIFRKKRDKNRLMIALIINEQNVIHNPVIRQPYFKKKVFFSFPYILQNQFLINAVLLPTREGRLYGTFIQGFTNIDNRITIGKNLATQLFHRDVYPAIMDFILHVEHTGSRIDYERYLSIHLPKSSMLRMTFPIIDHQDNIRNDWYLLGGMKKKWFKPLQVDPLEIGMSFYQKRHLLYAYYHIKSMFD